MKKVEMNCCWCKKSYITNQWHSRELDIEIIGTAFCSPKCRNNFDKATGF